MMFITASVYKKGWEVPFCIVVITLTCFLMFTRADQPDASYVHAHTAQSASGNSLGPASMSRQLLQQHTDMKSTDAQQHQHKPLFPIGSLDIAILAMAGVVLFIAAGAGMGGGPVLVPLYLVAGLTNTAAVALSNSTILAGSVGNVLCNARKRHPFKNKPLVDWDLVLLMEPPTLVGAIAGSYINKLMPSWITAILLSVLLLLMTVRVVQRASRIYKRESAARKSEAAAVAADGAIAAAADSTAQAGAIPDPQRLHEARQGRFDVLESSVAAVPGQACAAASSVSAVANNADDPALLRAAAPSTMPRTDGEESGTRNGSPFQQQSSVVESDAEVYLLANAAGVRPPDSCSNSTSTCQLGALSPPRGTLAGGADNQQRQQQRWQQWQHQQQVPQATATPVSTAPHAPRAGTAGSGYTSPLRGGSGYSSPFRGSLSTVPSSVLLNVELEGNISEAALQRFAMLEASRSISGSLDAIDASLASMYGIHVGHAVQPRSQQQQVQRQAAELQCSESEQQQQQVRVLPGASMRLGQQQQQRDSQLQEQQGDGAPPSEAECRLAYAPPGHSRRDSWELAWQDEQHTMRDISFGGAQSSSTAGTGTSPSNNASSSCTITAANTPGFITQAAPPGKFHPAVAAAPAAAAAGIELAAHMPAPAMATARAAAPAIPEPLPPIRSTESSSGGAAKSSSSQSRLLQPAAPEVAAALRADAVELMLHREAAQLPLEPVLLLVLMFVAVLLTSLFSKMVKCGSAAYWLVQWSAVPVLFGVWWFSRHRVLAKVALKKAAQMDFHGEVRWTPKKTVVFPAICSLAGVIAGMFGLGGAVVKTPLMLELGVHPSVTAATTQTMLLLTSAAASIVYAQMGDTPWDWAMVMLPMAFCATLAGQAAIDWLVKKVGRSSMVVLVLAAFFVVATGLSFYTLSMAIRRVAGHPELLVRIGRICL